ncbi:MAG: hypothetical protein PHH54_05890 [Candidatus Nanoarchaeia archaeon]|nr:hypothetical protein [Candidatus Nanoarchaeia archaeon]MDD5741486.1 hypothetical protein [Candidatus Nanoarchaeia archaeon]
MVSWLIIGILVVLVFLVLNLGHMKHRVWVFLIVLLVLFLYISISVVYHKYDLSFDSTEGAVDSAKIYLGWLGNGFSNMKTLVGNAVKMDWTTSNESSPAKTNSSSKSNSDKLK